MPSEACLLPCFAPLWVASACIYPTGLHHAQREPQRAVRTVYVAEERKKHGMVAEGPGEIGRHGTRWHAHMRGVKTFSCLAVLQKIVETYIQSVHRKILLLATEGGVSISEVGWTQRALLHTSL